MTASSKFLSVTRRRRLEIAESGYSGSDAHHTARLTGANPSVEKETDLIPAGPEDI
jgi:hypothetical protein